MGVADQLDHFRLNTKVENEGYNLFETLYLGHYSEMRPRANHCLWHSSA